MRIVYICENIDDSFSQMLFVACVVVSGYSVMSLSMMAVARCCLNSDSVYLWWYIPRCPPLPVISCLSSNPFSAASCRKLITLARLILLEPMASQTCLLLIPVGLFHSAFSASTW